MHYGSTFTCIVALTIPTIWLVPSRFRPTVLLIASYLCLGVWSVGGLAVLGFVTLSAYVLGRIIELQPSRLLVGFSIALILSPLWLAKLSHIHPDLRIVYDPISDASSQNWGPWSFVRPFGLAFFSLQGVSYVVDVYRQRASAEKQFVALALYLAFFPKLLAGPIERANNFLIQLRPVRSPESRAIIRAAKFILIGLFAKLVMADALAAVGEGLSRAHAGGGVTALACAAYSYEIYLDFYAYSAMAIGVSGMFGIKLSDNFCTPYGAQTLREFWHRWHITLSSWMRDYLYKPLGGNRGSEARRWAAVVVVFLASGLWHGVELVFICWAGVHATMYIIGTSTEPIRGRLRSAFGLTSVPGYGAFRAACVFSLVSIAWIPFRSESLTAALETLSRLIGIIDSQAFWSLGDASIASVVATVSLVSAVMVLDMFRAFERFPVSEPSGTWTRLAEFVAMDTMILLVLLFGSGDVSPSFTYFAF